MSERRHNGAGDGSGDRARPALEPTGERLVPGSHPDHIVEAEHLARYEMIAAIASGRSVLDAGSGAGYGAAILSRAGAESVAGIDSDEAAIAFARDRYGEEASFEIGNLMTLPFDDDCFDLVVCFEAIEHVSDHELALDELQRVLAPGGLIAVSSPNRGVYREDNPFHVHELSSEELRETLAARFAGVRLYRQQVHMASIVSGDDGQAAADPSTEIAATVRKLASQAPGEELYALALAGDGELPELPSVVMLAGGVAVRQWQDAAAAWEQRARRAEAECDAMEIELGHLGKSKAGVLEELEELRRRIAAAGRRGRRITRGD